MLSGSVTGSRRRCRRDSVQDASAASLSAAAVAPRICVMPDPEQEPRSRPSAAAFLSNWATYDASFATKLRMATSNTFYKLRHRQPCCGNNGQPGC